MKTPDTQKRIEAYVRKVKAELREDGWTAEQKTGMRAALRWFSKVFVTEENDGDSGKAQGHTGKAEEGSRGQ